jgi:SAM-dependent methyltransferase
MSNATNTEPTPETDLWALRRLARATRLQQWMFAALKPSTPGPMLEVGAGIGTFTHYLLDAGADPLLLLEPEAACVRELERTFAGDGRVEIAQELLPGAPTLTGRPGSFAYAVCQNVLEHIEDDVAALTAVVSALEPGGELAILTPAHPSLYGRLDRTYGHVRRYTRSQLRGLIAAAGAELTSIRSFNALGLPGWWLAGKTNAVDITDGALAVYEALVVPWRPIEDLLRLPVGLSLVARARRPGRSSR